MGASHHDGNKLRLPRYLTKVDFVLPHISNMKETRQEKHFSDNLKMWNGFNISKKLEGSTLWLQKNKLIFKKIPKIGTQ